MGAAASSLLSLPQSSSSAASSASTPKRPPLQQPGSPRSPLAPALRSAVPAPTPRDRVMGDPNLLTHTLDFLSPLTVITKAAAVSKEWRGLTCG